VLTPTTVANYIAKYVTKDGDITGLHSSPAAAQRYLHAVDGRDAEIASALSDLAAHGNAARLPKSIVVKH